MLADGEPDGDCLALDWTAECAGAAALDRGGAVARQKSFARVFQWLFPCRFPCRFPIKERGGRAVPRGVGDRGASILPTSPRPIEVWS
jgi:hypothetical protein